MPRRGRAGGEFSGEGGSRTDATSTLRVSRRFPDLGIRTRDRIFNDRVCHEFAIRSTSASRAVYGVKRQKPRYSAKSSRRGKRIRTCGNEASGILHSCGRALGHLPVGKTLRLCTGQDDDSQVLHHPMRRRSALIRDGALSESRQSMPSHLRRACLSAFLECTPTYVAVSQATKRRSRARRSLFGHVGKDTVRRVGHMLILCSAMSPHRLVSA